MKYKKPIGLVLLILLWTGVTAQAQRTLSLDQCVDIGLQNNKTLLMSEQDYRKARAQIVETRAGALPQVTMNGSFSYQREQPFISFPDSAGNYTKIPLGEKDNYSFSASLRQPIFDAAAFIAPQASKIFSRYARENVNATEDQVILMIKSAYYQVLLAESLVDVAQQSLSLAQSNLELVQKYRQTGQASDYDVLRAEVDVANLQPQLTQAENDYEIAMINLKNTLSINVNEEISLSDSLGYEPLEMVFDPALDSAKVNRPDLKALEFQIDGWKKYVRAQQSARLPTLNGIVQYNADYDHYKVDGDNWNTTLTGILSLDFNNIPFLDGGRLTGVIRQGQADLEKAKLMYDQLLDNVVLEIRQALLNLNEASRRVESTQLNINRAEEALKIAELRYSGGQNTQLEVKDARVALTRARTNYSLALHDHNIARAQLEKAMGIIK